MTNDELNKLTEGYQSLNDETNKFISELVADLDKLISIIYIQKETLEFYGGDNYSSVYDENYGDIEISIDINDVDLFEENTTFGRAGKKARETQSAVNAKLKEMGFEI